MLIAIIDDGILPLMFEKVIVSKDLFVTDNNTVEERTEEYPILTLHGTICAAIISNYYPNAEFYSIKIFHNTELKTSYKKLISALKWCKNNGIRMIHMSVGSKRIIDGFRLFPIISSLVRKGVFLVASHSSDSRHCYPADLKGVIRVFADKSLHDRQYRIEKCKRRIIIHASAKHEIQTSKNHKWTTQNASSFASPTITATLCEILSDTETCSQIKPSTVYRFMHGSTE